MRFLLTVLLICGFFLTQKSITATSLEEPLISQASNQYLAQNEDEGEDKDEDEGEGEDEGEDKDEDDKTKVEKKVVEKKEKKAKKIVPTVWLMKQIERIRQGDKKALTEIRFHNFETIIFVLNDEAAKRKKTVLQELANRPTQIRRIVRVFLGGLSNTDPRIRLTSAVTLIDLLKVLKTIQVPDKNKDGSIISEEKKAKLKSKYKKFYYTTITAMHPYTRRSWYLETVTNRKYLSRDLKGEPVAQPVYKEIDILDLYITREIALHRLKEGTLRPEDFKNANPRLYRCLTERIANEDEENVPIYSLENNVDILIYSLGNNNQKVRERSANYLLRIFYSPVVESDNQIKLKIESARDDYPILDRYFKDYVKKQQEAKKKEELAKVSQPKEDKEVEDEGEEDEGEEEEDGK